MPRAKKADKKETVVNKDVLTTDAAVTLANAVAEVLGVPKNSIEVGLGNSGEIPGWVLTGVPQLDYAVGGYAHPGFPMGRVIELHGVESSGKTTVALLIMKSVLKQYPDSIGFYEDMEYSLNNENVRGIGMDESRFIHSQQSNLEEVFKAQEAAFNSCKSSGKRVCFVVDSLASSPSQRAMEGEVGDTQVADVARVMSAELKKTINPLSKTGSMAIWVNQMRNAVGVMYGDPHVVPGGDTMKYHSTVRLRFYTAEKIKSADNKFIIGAKLHIKVHKSRVSRPGTDIYFTLDIQENDRGSYVTVDTIKAQIEWCTSRGLINKSGAYYEWKGNKYYLSRLTERIRASEDETAELYNLAYSIQPMPSGIQVDSDTGEVLENVR